MRKLLLNTLFLFTICALSVWAQAGTGTLTGKISSASGTVVPNAAVTITNTSTNTSQKVLTGPDGSFSISGLAPGTYRVDVETAGFKRTTEQNVELVAGGPSTVNIVLEAGNMNETVEIKATSPMIQTDSSEVAMGLGTRTVRELPVIDRNHQELTGLMSGITPPAITRPDSIDPARNREWSNNGQSPLANIQNLDGVVNREPFRGTAVRVQPAETVQQLRITTSNYAADKGFAGGTVLDTLTRPGTNNWHGSLFEFHSDNNLRARSPFNVAGNSDPRYVYNQWGGTAGGHIVRDKLFFFGSYEGTYQNGSQTQLGTVPTAEMRAGNFGGLPAGFSLYNPNTGASTGLGRTPFANNTIPQSMINPFSASLAAQLPLPNQAGFANNYVANVPFRNNGDKADARMDWHFSDRTGAFVRYGFTNYRVDNSSLLGDLASSAANTNLIAHNAVVNLTHSFTPNLITEGRFGFNRYSDATHSLGGPMESIQIAGLAGLGTPANSPMHAVDNTFDWVNSWNLHTSMHNVKWGIDIQRYRSDGFMNPMFGPLGGALFGPGSTLLNGGAGFGPAGSFANSWAAFLLGAPSVTGSASFTETPTYRQTWYSAWLGDTITLMRRVTLDLGVRYEIYSPLEPRRAGGAAFFDPAGNTFNFAGLNGTGMHLVNYDLNNIAPRVGLAVRITDKTAFRAGYGISYFQVPYQFSGLMPAMTGSAEGTAGGYTVVPGMFGAGSAAGSAAASGVQNGMTAGNLPVSYTMSQMDTPYVQSFNAKLQQELGKGFVLDLGYFGTLGRHLPLMEETNLAMPGTGMTGLPFAAFGRTSSTLLYDTGLTNNYNALQINLAKRFAHGLSFQAAYTYSKALDYGSLGMPLINPFDRGANYGPADYDRQHNLVISHLWQLPFGAGTNHLNHGIVGQIVGNWQINGIFRWASGTPFSVFADPLLCACPGNAQVPANINGTVNYTNMAGVNQSFFDTSAFSAPAPGQIGNLGRNALRGPGFRNYDLSLFRSFPIREHYKLEFRGEAYNLTNSPRWNNPGTNLNSADFGQITSTSMLAGAYGRQVNVAVRILF